MDLSKATVRILVKGDYGACFDFYTQTLGMVPVWGDRSGPYTSLAQPGQSGACMALFAVPEMELFPGYSMPGGSAPCDTITVVVPCDDLDGDYKRLKAAGVAFIGQPTHMEGWGMRCVYLRDPEGNLIELNDAAGV